MSISISLGEILLAELAGIVDLSPAQVALLEAHYTLLLRWNEKLNLTTVTKLPEAAIRHYGESLFLAKHLSDPVNCRPPSGCSVVDIGTGAGFPGIPAAILRPDFRFDLVESHQRKAVFLREATRGVPNIRVLATRASALVGDTYDWVISRAVDAEEVLDAHLGRKFAFLMGGDDALRIEGAVVIPLPWGDRRVLTIGSRDDVPRET